MIGPVNTEPAKEAWYYSRDAQKFGPTDLGGLRKMAAALHLAPESLVWSEGLPAWVPATTIETLVFPAPQRPEPDSDAATAEAERVGQVARRYPLLYRSSDERAFLGVCAGFAHKWSVPVVALRIAVPLLIPFLMGWAYFLGVFLPAVPTRPDPDPPAPPPPVPPPLPARTAPPTPPAPPRPSGLNMASF